MCFDICDIRYVIMLYDMVGCGICYDMVCDMIYYVMLYGIIRDIWYVMVVIEFNLHYIFHELLAG
jgi:hypothetical protein